MRVRVVNADEGGEILPCHQSMPCVVVKGP